MNKQFIKSFNRLKDKSLNELLEEITVMEIDEECAKINNNLGIIGWYGVVSDLGIIAYFGEEPEAYRYRLDYINRILNS